MATFSYIWQHLYLAFNLNINRYMLWKNRVIHLWGPNIKFYGKLNDNNSDIIFAQCNKIRYHTGMYEIDRVRAILSQPNVGKYWFGYDPVWIYHVHCTLYTENTIRKWYALKILYKMQQQQQQQKTIQQTELAKVTERRIPQNQNQYQYQYHYYCCTVWENMHTTIYRNVIAIIMI